MFEIVLLTLLTVCGAVPIKLLADAPYRLDFVGHQMQPASFQGVQKIVARTARELNGNAFAQAAMEDEKLALEKSNETENDDDLVDGDTTIHPKIDKLKQHAIKLVKEHAKTSKYNFNGRFTDEPTEDTSNLETQSLTPSTGTEVVNENETGIETAPLAMTNSSISDETKQREQMQETGKGVTEEARNKTKVEESTLDETSEHKTKVPYAKAPHPVPLRASDYLETYVGGGYMKKGDVDDLASRFSLLQPQETAGKYGYSKAKESQATLIENDETIESAVVQPSEGLGDMVENDPNIIPVVQSPPLVSRETYTEQLSEEGKFSSTTESTDETQQEKPDQV